MRQKLQEKVSLKGNWRTKILDCGAESIPMASDSCDAVVSTLVLCSVSNQSTVLSEIYRILRPGGTLVFIEHVADLDIPKHLKWQQRIEPFWKIAACGCHLTRLTDKAIVNAGFVFDEITKQNICGAPFFVRKSIKGIAVKPG